MSSPELDPNRSRKDGRGAPQRKRWPMGDRSGQVLALFAVFSIPLLAMLALGIDWGMLLTARKEAQRAADSGALAGAAMFRGCSVLECASRAQPAEDTAISYAANNWIRSTKIAPSEVTVQVDVSERLVRVFVDREGVPTFFAHLLGIPVKPIGAVAAAKVSSGGIGQCVMPFFGPDLWREPGDDNQIPETGEADTWEWGEDGQDFTPEDGEIPVPIPQGCPDGLDCYQPVQADGSGTGYGSNFRNGLGDVPYTNDLGRRIVISSSSPGGNSESMALGEMVQPGNFQLWSPPIPDSKTGECDPENPTYATGGADLRNILDGDIECTCPISLEEQQEFDPETGQKWGPVTQGIEDRIADDELSAQWSEQDGLTCTINGVAGSGADCYGSSRVVPIALSSPAAVLDLTGASVPIVFNNFARIYLEEVVSSGSDKIVYGRFLGRVAGAGGPESGELIEYLRLVE